MTPMSRRRSNESKTRPTTLPCNSAGAEPMALVSPSDTTRLRKKPRSPDEQIDDGR